MERRNQLLYPYVDYNLADDPSLVSLFETSQQYARNDGRVYNSADGDQSVMSTQMNRSSMPYPEDHPGTFSGKHKSRRKKKGRSRNGHVRATSASVQGEHSRARNVNGSQARNDGIAQEKGKPCTSAPLPSSSSSYTKKNEPNANSDHRNQAKKKKVASHKQSKNGNINRLSCIIQ